MCKRKIINLRRNIPPKPKRDNLLIQIDWIFNQQASLYGNEASQQSYFKTLSFYKNQFMKYTFNYDDRLKAGRGFYLDEQWTETAFFKVDHWIKEVRAGKHQEVKVLSSHSYSAHLSRIRAVMNLAYEYRLIDKPVLNVPTTSAYKETITFEPYSGTELSRLTKVLDRYIEAARQIIQEAGIV